MMRTADGGFIGQVGDTIVAVQGPQQHLAIICSPSHLEYANQTEFLTDRGWSDHLRLTGFFPGDVDSLAISSDRLRFKILSDLKYYSPIATFFEDVFHFACSDGATSEAVTRFLEGLDDQSGDDKTLVIAVNGVGSVMRWIGPESPSAAASHSQSDVGTHPMPLGASATTQNENGGRMTARHFGKSSEV
jgi:hypothetical protein